MLVRQEVINKPGAMDSTDTAESASKSTSWNKSLYLLIPVGIVIAVFLLLYKTTLLGRPISQIGMLAFVDSFFNPDLISRSVPIRHDPSGYGTYFAFSHFMESVYRTGQMPLWNPQNGCGFPMIAAISHQIFSLFHLFSLFESARTYDYLVVLKTMIAALGSFALARSLGISWLAAIFASFAYAFCPRVLTNTPLCTNECFFPVVTLQFVWLAKKPSLLRAAVSGLVCALALMNMQPEACFFSVIYASIACGVLILFGGDFSPVLKETKLVKRLLVFAKVLIVTAILSILFAAPVVLPFFELLANAHLYKDIMAETGAVASLQPLDPSLKHFLKYARGLLFGPVPDGSWSHQSFLYTGPLVILLIPIAASSPRKARVSALLVALWIFSVYTSSRPVEMLLGIKALGNLASGHGAPFVPLIGLLAAASALDRISEVDDISDHGRKKIIFWIASIVTLALLIATFGFIDQPLSLETILHNLPRESFFLLAGYVAIILSLKVSAPWRKLTILSLIALNLVALSIHSRKCLPNEPRFNLEPPPVARFLAEADKDRDVAGSRFVGIGNNYFLPCSNLFYGINDLRNRSALNPKRYLAYFDQIGKEQIISISSNANHLIDLASTRYIVTRSALSAFSGIETIDSFKSRPEQVELDLASSGHVIPGFRILSANIAFDKVDSQVAALLNMRIHGNVDGRYSLEPVVARLTNAKQYDVLWLGQRLPLSLSKVARESEGGIAAFDTFETSLAIDFPVPLDTALGSDILIGLRVFDDWTGVHVEADGKGLSMLDPHLLKLSSFAYESARAKISSVDDNRRFELVFESLPNRIYKNRNALPQAYFCENALLASSAEQALELVKEGSPSLLKGETVIIESVDSISTQENQEFGARQTVNVSIERPDCNTVLLHLKSPEKGYVVLTDTYYPGWQAFIDGEPAPILRANYLFRAVAVQSGEHDLEFRYFPRSYRNGLYLAGLAALILMLIVWLSIRKKQN